MIEIEFVPHTTILAGEWFALANDMGGRSIREPLKRCIQQVVGPAFVENFEVGGNPSWEPLSEETVKRKAIYGQTSDPLIGSGALQKKSGQLNIWSIDGQGDDAEARLENLGDQWYGFVHQAGATAGHGATIPARPWATLDERDIDKMEEIFGQWLDERIGANLGGV